MQSFLVVGLEGFPLVRNGDDLAKLIVEATERNSVVFDDGDVVVVSQKIVSKAEGRLVRLREVIPSERAKEIAAITGKEARFVELVLRESRRVVKAAPGFLIVEDNRGWVCMNAGIDRSNVSFESDLYSLLPANPDDSAKKMRQEIMRLCAKKVGVLICDTYSRPFRRGQAEFVIGVAGVKVFRDYRGEKDLFGYVLQVKNVALVDELACAAELLMGQGREAVPVAVIRGLKRAELCEEDESSTQELRLKEGEDLFEDAL